MNLIHIQRKQVIFILKQNDGFDGRLIGGLLMLRRIHAPFVEALFRIQHLGLNHYTQYIGHLLVHNTFGNGTTLNSRNQRIGKKPLVVIVHHGSHLQIETSQSSLYCTVRAPPVGHCYPFESHLITEQRTVHVCILRTPVTSELVIGIHNRVAATFFDSRFKGGKINFAKRTFAHQHIYRGTVCLLVIGQVMLNTGCHIARLQSLNIRHSKTGV